MKTSELKNEMETAFSEMERLLEKANYAVSLAKKYPEAETLILEADELMLQWSAMAKKYVAASKAYHNATYGNMPI